MAAKDGDLEFSYGSKRDCERIRRNVFIEEQGFENEFDPVDDDPQTLHIAAFEDGLCVGCIRVYPTCAEDAPDPLPAGGDSWTLGRLAVSSGARGHGIGSGLVHEAERACRARGADSTVLHAQLAKRGFYEKLGYAASDGIDDDEGVPHIWMSKGLD